MDFYKYKKERISIFICAHKKIEISFNLINLMKNENSLISEVIEFIKISNIKI